MNNNLPPAWNLEKALITKLQINIGWPYKLLFIQLAIHEL